MKHRCAGQDETAHATSSGRGDHHGMGLVVFELFFFFPIEWLVRSLFPDQGDRTWALSSENMKKSPNH